MIRGGHAFDNDLERHCLHVYNRADTCLGYADGLDSYQGSSTCSEFAAPSTLCTSPMAPTNETLETVSKGAKGDGSSSVYSHEDERSTPPSKRTVARAPEREEPECTPSETCKSEGLSEVTTSTSDISKGPDENIVDFINRKRSKRIARRRAEKEAEKASERELAATPARPPEGPSPPRNPNTDFSPRPPGTYSLCLRGPARFYIKAHVLTVHWSPMCIGLPAAVRELKGVIRKHYGYEVTHCALPAHRNAPQVLAQALAELVAMYGGGGGTLVVLHYTGQSRTDARSFRICPPTWACCPAAVEVDLHALLCDTLLSPAFGPDVLCLLDCAYALESRGRPCEGKEILAASVEPSRFTLRDRSVNHSFTRNITARLGRAMCSVHFYTDELEENLIKDAEPRTWRFPTWRGMFGDDEAAKRTVALPTTKGVAGLRTGMGPPRRYIFLAPLVSPWQYWQMKNKTPRKGCLEVEDVEARCFICGRLSKMSALAHKHMCRRVPVRGVCAHTYEIIQDGTGLDEA